MALRASAPVLPSLRVVAGLPGLVVSLAAALSTSCQAVSGWTSEPDAGDVTTFYIDTVADDKQVIYNLVGRWYPEEEVRRLSDRTLTPEQWCQREPSMIFVNPDSVTVRCEKGPEQTAMIATAQRHKDGKIVIAMRAKEDSKMRQLTFTARGPQATIAGSPCVEGQQAEFKRFPEYEILGREILGGRRCAQIIRPGVEP